MKGMICHFYTQSQPHIAMYIYSRLSKECFKDLRTIINSPENLSLIPKGVLEEVCIVCGFMWDYDLICVVIRLAYLYPEVPTDNQCIWYC